MKTGIIYKATTPPVLMQFLYHLVLAHKRDAQDVLNEICLIKYRGIYYCSECNILVQFGGQDEGIYHYPGI